MIARASRSVTRCAGSTRSAPRHARRASRASTPGFILRSATLAGGNSGNASARRSSSASAAIVANESSGTRGAAIRVQTVRPPSNLSGTVNPPLRTFFRLLAVAGLALACSRAEVAPTWHDEQGYRWRELAVTRGEPGFTRIQARSSGIDFQNTVSDSALLRNRMVGQGAGVALGDVDGDGLVDVCLGRTEGCSALFRNRGGWKFENVTETAGVGVCDRFTTGVAFADIDGDGDLDLPIVATRGPNAIFVNDGAGRFTERRDLGVDSTGKGGTTVALADVDGNGSLDMFVANYKPYNIDDSLPPQRRSFSQMVRQTGPNQYEIVPEHRGEYKLVSRPDMGGLRMSARAATDDFYLNAGGRFSRVSMASERFRDPQGKPLGEEPESFTL